jgi:methylmalonyl-CoA mutase, C-terminal domain
LLREREGQGITVIGGGVIPIEDVPALKEAGVEQVFQPGTSTEEIILFIKDCLKGKQKVF